jgi:hypothetical protein
VHVKVPQVIKEREFVQHADRDATRLVGTRGQRKEDRTGSVDNGGSVNVRGIFDRLGQATVRQGVAKLPGILIVRGQSIARSARFAAKRRFLRCAEQGNERVL